MDNVTDQNKFITQQIVLLNRQPCTPYSLYDIVQGLEMWTTVGCSQVNNCCSRLQARYQRWMMLHSLKEKNERQKMCMLVLDEVYQFHGGVVYGNAVNVKDDQLAGTVLLFVWWTNIYIKNISNN